MGFWAVPASDPLLALGSLDITEPEQGEEFEDDDTISPSGTCAVANKVLKVTITNVYDDNGVSKTVTTSYEVTSSEEYEWDSGSSTTTLHGEGTWTVKVEFKDDSSENFSVNGDVNGEPI